jgi:hypothetical protein
MRVAPRSCGPQIMPTCIMQALLWDLEGFIPGDGILGSSGLPKLISGHILSCDGEQLDMTRGTYGVNLVGYNSGDHVCERTCSASLSSVW